MTPTLRLRLLGTGTSQGIPVIGCRCAVCRSTDPRDNRLRTAAMFEVGDVRIAVDMGPDFRQQMLRAGIDDVRAVLITHEHNDHVSGLDDLRPINFLHNRDIPVYGLSRVLDDIRGRFAYAFDDAYIYPGKPRVITRTVEDSAFTVENVTVTPLPADHGGLPVLGYRIGSAAYLTDVKTLPPATLDRLEGLDVLVLNALRRRPHPTHLNIDEACALAERLRPRRCILTHISHDMGLHADVSGSLPAGVELGFDGLVAEASAS